MKILITWWLGFIWSHFVIKAIKQWFEVVNIDKETYAANKKNVLEIENDKNYKYIKWDICDNDLIKNLFAKEKFDIVVNFAAESHVDKSIENPDIFVQTNILWTNILLKNSLNFWVKKYIQISTDEVYWDLQIWESAFIEENQLQPNSPYSASKASADLMVRSYAKTFWLPAIITRCSNNFWPHQDSSKLIPVIVKKALNNEQIPIYWTWKNIRDWIFVLDHVNWIFKAMDKWIPWEIYNFWWWKELSNIEICKMILKILWKSEDLISFVEDRKWHDFRYAVNDTKAQKELWWKREWDFESNLEKTVEYLRDQFI